MGWEIGWLGGGAGGGGLCVCVVELWINSNNGSFFLVFFFYNHIMFVKVMDAIIFQCIHKFTFL